MQGDSGRKGLERLLQMQSEAGFLNSVEFLFRKMGKQTGFLLFGGFNRGVATKEKQEADNTNHWLISVWSRRKGKISREGIFPRKATQIQVGCSGSDKDVLPNYSSGLGLAQPQMGNRNNSTST